MISEVPAVGIVAMIRRHLDSAGFADVGINVMSAYDWYQTSVQSSVLQATLKTLDQYGCPRTIWPVQGFGGPWAHFAKVFAIPSLQGGSPGHGARMATSDEFLVVEGRGGVAGLVTIERYYVDFLYAFAAEEEHPAGIGEPASALERDVFGLNRNECFPDAA